jgi:predicted phage gp36 major capsid-like protein
MIDFDDEEPTNPRVTYWPGMVDRLTSALARRADEEERTWPGRSSDVADDASELRP